MILLDTNYLIGSLVPGSPFNQRTRQWLTAGEILGISTIAWAEFLCGPLSAEDATAAAELLPTPGEKQRGRESLIWFTFWGCPFAV